MIKLSKHRISEYRKRLRQLLDSLEIKTFKTIHPGPLFRGSPAEVYRRCGNPSCRCAKGGEYRHGPYKVIQVNKDGKQRQLALKKDQEKYFDMAKLYVLHKENHKRVGELLEAIDKLMDEVIKARTVEKIGDDE